jgi:trehalose synthase
VVASGIGGIGDQIEHGRSGLLLDDPSDPIEFAAAVRALLEDPVAAAALGDAARERVRKRFLGTHSLMDYLDVIEPLLRGEEAA